jgi:hypothetical protein
MNGIVRMRLSPAVHCYNRKEAVLTITSIHIDIHMSHSEFLFKKSKSVLSALSNKQKGKKRTYLKQRRKQVERCNDAPSNHTRRHYAWPVNDEWHSTAALERCPFAAPQRTCAATSHFIAEAGPVV